MNAATRSREAPPDSIDPASGGGKHHPFNLNKNLRELVDVTPQRRHKHLTAGFAAHVHAAV